MAKSNISLINIDKDIILELQNKVDTSAKDIDILVDRLVNDYCKPLNDYMQFIRGILEDTNQPPIEQELDDFMMNLPVLLYFTGEAQEAVGVREDIAKALRQEIYNKSYEKADGTVADKTAVSEMASRNEYIVQIVYQRAYKVIKNKMESASELLQSVKKVVTRRMSEYELSKVDPGRITKNA